MEGVRLFSGRTGTVPTSQNNQAHNACPGGCAKCDGRPSGCNQCSGNRARSALGIPTTSPEDTVRFSQSAKKTNLK